MKHTIFTDGSAQGGNPGIGGWGMIVFDETEMNVVDYVHHNQIPQATNNQMELRAMLCALQYASDHPDIQFIIYSDSSYVVNSCNEWIWNWAKNGWVNSKKKTVENLDLMKEIYSYLSRDFFNVVIRRCPGHSEIIGNELADALATGAMKKFFDMAEDYQVSFSLPTDAITEVRNHSLFFPS